MIPTSARMPLAQHPDGEWYVEGVERVQRVEVVRDDTPVRDWLAELDIPKDWTLLDEMATPRGLSGRHLLAILGDESPTKLPDAPLLQPATWTWGADIAVTLSHLPLVVGVASMVMHAKPGAWPDTTGETVVGILRLYDSPLAAKAWEGVERGIFRFTSCILERPLDAPPGTGRIQEIGLTDSPGCPNARVTETWTRRA